MPHPTHLIPTTVVGSYSQLDWLVDRAALMHQGVPRISARDICRIPVKAENVPDAKHARSGDTCVEPTSYIAEIEAFRSWSARMISTASSARHHLPRLGALAGDGHADRGGARLAGLHIRAR